MWLTHDITFFFLVYLIMLYQLQLPCSTAQQTDCEGLRFWHWCWWRLNSSWKWHCVIACVFPNILQTRSAFIFLVSKPLKINVLWLWNISNNMSNCSVISLKNWFTAWWKCDLAIWSALAPLFWECWSYVWWSFDKVLSSRILNSKIVSNHKFL